jgi:hypothetical protein
MIFVRIGTNLMSIIFELCTLVRWNPCFTYGNKIILICSSHVYWQIRWPLVQRCAHNILICFWVREGHTALMVINKMICTCTVKLCDILIVKNALVRSLEYSKEYTICSITGLVNDEQFLLWIWIVTCCHCLHSFHPFHHSACREWKWWKS